MEDERVKQDYENIEEIVNNCGFRPVAVALKLAKMHRYLQEQFFTLCLNYMARLAKAYKDGRYDARNENACTTAYKMFTEGLGEEALESRNQYIDMVEQGSW